MYPNIKRKASTDKGSVGTKKLKISSKIFRNPNALKGNAKAKAKYELMRLLPEDYMFRIERASIKEIKDYEGYKGIVGFVRLSIASKEAATTWIKKFENKTFTRYQIQGTWEEDNVIGYNKAKYICKHCNLNDNSDCKGCIIFTVQNQEEDKNNLGFCERKYPSEVKIYFLHNHRIDQKSDMNDLCKSAKPHTTFHTYFCKGHSPISALICHVCDLHSAYALEFYNIISNESICPSYNWCLGEYKRLFKRKFIEPSETVLNEKLENLVTKYNLRCGSNCAIVTKNPTFFLSICTPLMKNTFKSGLVDNVLIVRCFSANNRKLILLSCFTCVGFLPLGLIVTFIDDENVIVEGIQSIIKMSTVTTYLPEVIIMDESTCLYNSFRKCFPKAIIVFNEFKILQSVWRIIRVICTHNKDSQSLYELFWVTLNSTCEKDFQRNFNELLMYAEKYPQLSSFFTKFQLKLSYYVLYLKPNINYNNDILNYVDSSLNILQDVAVKYQRFFNVVQLFHFLTENLMLHYERKLNRFLQGCLIGFFNTNFYVPLSTIDEITIERLNKSEFQVNLNNSNFFVNLELNTCTCLDGFHGLFCIHNYIVRKNIGILQEPFKSSSDDNLIFVEQILKEPKDKPFGQHRFQLEEPDTELECLKSLNFETCEEIIDLPDLSNIVFPSEINNFSDSPKTVLFINNEYFKQFFNDFVGGMNSLLFNQFNNINDNCLNFETCNEKGEVFKIVDKSVSLSKVNKSKKKHIFLAQRYRTNLNQEANLIIKKREKDNTQQLTIDEENQDLDDNDNQALEKSTKVSKFFTDLKDSNVGNQNLINCQIEVVYEDEENQLQRFNDENRFLEQDEIFYKNTEIEEILDPASNNTSFALMGFDKIENTQVVTGGIADIKTNKQSFSTNHIVNESEDIENGASVNNVSEDLDEEDGSSFEDNDLDMMSPNNGLNDNGCVDTTANYRKLENTFQPKHRNHNALNSSTIPKITLKNHKIIFPKFSIKKLSSEKSKVRPAMIILDKAGAKRNDHMVMQKKLSVNGDCVSSTLKRDNKDQNLENMQGDVSGNNDVIDLYCNKTEAKSLDEKQQHTRRFKGKEMLDIIEKLQVKPLCLNESSTKTSSIKQFSERSDLNVLYDYKENENVSEQIQVGCGSQDTNSEKVDELQELKAEEMEMNKLQLQSKILKQLSSRGVRRKIPKTPVLNEAYLTIGPSRNLSLKRLLSKEKCSEGIGKDVSEGIRESGSPINLKLSEKQLLQMHLTMAFAKLKDLINSNNFQTPIKTFLTKFRELGTGDKLLAALKNFGSEYQLKQSKDKMIQTNLISDVDDDKVILETGNIEVRKGDEQEYFEKKSVEKRVKTSKISNQTVYEKEKSFEKQASNNSVDFQINEENNLIQKLEDNVLSKIDSDPVISKGLKPQFKIRPLFKNKLKLSKEAEMLMSRIIRKECAAKLKAGFIKTNKHQNLPAKNYHEDKSGNKNIHEETIAIIAPQQNKKYVTGDNEIINSSNEILLAKRETMASISLNKGNVNDSIVIARNIKRKCPTFETSVSKKVNKKNISYSEDTIKKKDRGKITIQKQQRVDDTLGSKSKLTNHSYELESTLNSFSNEETREKATPLPLILQEDSDLAFLFNDPKFETVIIEDETPIIQKLAFKEDAREIPAKTKARQKAKNIKNKEVELENQHFVSKVVLTHKHKRQETKDNKSKLIQKVNTKDRVSEAIIAQEKFDLEDPLSFKSALRSFKGKGVDYENVFSKSASTSKYRRFKKGFQQSTEKSQSRNKMTDLDISNMGTTRKDTIKRGRKKPVLNQSYFSRYKRKRLSSKHSKFHKHQEILKEFSKDVRVVLERDKNIDSMCQEMHCKQRFIWRHKEHRGYKDLLATAITRKSI